jgi:hypothetical protein
MYTDFHQNMSIFYYIDIINCATNQTSSHNAYIMGSFYYVMQRIHRIG